MQNKEIWKDIPDYEGFYQVSNLGRILSIYRKNERNRLVGGCYIKPIITAYGYQQCTLYKNGKGVIFRIHRIVMYGFLGINKLPVNHLNGIKTDNRLINLEYCTHKENTIHAHKNNLIATARGENNCNSKLAEIDVIRIRKEAKSGLLSRKELSAKYKIAASTLSQIINRKRWKHI
jgi:hypothetical protein